MQESLQFTFLLEAIEFKIKYNVALNLVLIELLVPPFFGIL